MKTKTIFAAMASAALLSACSETDAPSSPQPTYDRYVDARNNAAAIVTGNQALPTNDSVTMNGAYEIISRDLLSTDSIVGQVQMTADFGNQTIDGKLHNNYVDKDGSAFALVGDVGFSGNIDGRTMDAHGEGTLVTVNEQQYDMYVDMTGTLNNSTGNGVNINDGVMTGSIDVRNDGSVILYDIMEGSEFAVAECLVVPISGICNP